MGVPDRIDRYTVAHRLGAGGMGEVLLAYSPAGDPVAIKLIRADRLDERTRARFEREAQVARTVIGTNRVARFLDADPYAERPWLVMEYVPGRTLQEHVDVLGPLPVVQVASLGALLAEGLSAVHAAGLLHRDLKPHNVVLGDYGPVIIDFGLAAFADHAAATLSDGGTIVGTVRCMPPEQASGPGQATAAADVYALGVVLLFAATGHYPYDGAQWVSVAAQVANEAVAPDLGGLPDPLVELVAAMTAHHAGDRPSLSEVTKRCTQIITAEGLTPMAARRRLIEATAARTPERDLSRFSSSTEDRLPRDPDPMRGALDRRPPGTDGEGRLLTRSEGATSTDEASHVDDVGDPISLADTNDGADSRADASRDAGQETKTSAGSSRSEPASRRIARELRRQYALRANL